jgi:hypothetical protein
LQKSVLFSTEKKIFKNAPHATKKKRTKCYKETLWKAATKTQQSISVMRADRVKLRLPTSKKT